MPLPLIGIAIVGGAIYLAKRFLQDTNKKKNIKKRVPIKRKNIKPINSRKKSLRVSYDKSEVNKHLILSASLLTLTIGGMFISPVLTLISIPGLIYLNLAFIKNAYLELFKEKKVGMATLDGILAILMLSLGYFFAIALFFTLYYISRNILLKTEDSSKKSLIDIWGEVPEKVWIEHSNGIDIEVNFDKLKIGDVVVVHAGETIPIDGIIQKGIGNVDQHILTGESQLSEKVAGDDVFASTILLSGKLSVIVNKTGTHTISSKIKNILNNTTDYKSTLQSKGEEVAAKSAVPTLLLGAVTLPILGISSATTILISSFGAQMRIVAPISVLNFLKIASENNILIKDGRALESLNKIDTVVFDKTGTLTQEQPSIQKIHTYHQETEDEILQYAAAAEYKQKHPIALAILEELKNRKLNLAKIDDANYNIGYGLKVKLGDKIVRVGSIRFMTMEEITIPPEVYILQDMIYDEGNSLVYVAINDDLSGAIELKATIRPEAKEIISDLHKRNMKVMIISGDHEKPTRQLAKELGIDDYFAETLPENKAQLIQELQQNGKSVCFIGDGINDSIALKQANVSISLLGASTIATDTAQVVFMDESLKRLPYLFDLSNRLSKNMKVGFTTSIIPGVVCVGGVYFFGMGVVAATIIYNIRIMARKFPKNSKITRSV
ncbi:MAG: heavy metal translocating P-type ATPase [Sulfurovum sp.]